MERTLGPVIHRHLYTALTLFTSLVWFVNGFICKILNLTPRHQQIVGRILGEEHAWLLTKMIGVGEVLIFVWIISRIKPRACAMFQMLMIGGMNIIESVLARDLLLFGSMNIVFAMLFIGVIYIIEFQLNKIENN